MGKETGLRASIVVPGAARPVFASNAIVNVLNRKCMVAQLTMARGPTTSSCLSLGFFLYYSHHLPGQDIPKRRKSHFDHNPAFRHQLPQILQKIIWTGNIVDISPVPGAPQMTCRSRLGESAVVSHLKLPDLRNYDTKEEALRYCIVDS